jgi:hypothetical protein
MRRSREKEAQEEEKWTSGAHFTPKGGMKRRDGSNANERLLGKEGGGREDARLLSP